MSLPITDLNPSCLYHAAHPNPDEASYCEEMDRWTHHDCCGDCGEPVRHEKGYHEGSFYYPPRHEFPCGHDERCDCPEDDRTPCHCPDGACVC